MKQKSNKLAKLERNRFSVFYEDLSYCCLCNNNYQITKHEIFEGSNRRMSMKYGYVLPLCFNCHRRITNDNNFLLHWKRIAQEHYESNYGSREDFIRDFGRNYL